jgi:anhydro-N-acetylmuramic acid kinase
MTYRAIGIMSGSSLDGVDMVCAELTAQNGQWSFELLAAECISYSDEWKKKLHDAIFLDALSYQLLHSEYGHYLGDKVNEFIERNALSFRVGLVSSHGHTSFHVPSKLMTAQLGDGAAIAAKTGLPVVSDLRAMDIAFGGQGAPIVPIGEKMLFPEYSVFLNLGGIANISFNLPDKYIAFDVCPANRVLNMIAATEGKEYDEGGAMASKGELSEPLLQKLAGFKYYSQPYPKSLANDFGTDEVYPLIQASEIETGSQLRTYVEHICLQIRDAVEQVMHKEGLNKEARKMMVTGGGALNGFLVDRLSATLQEAGIEVVVPEEKIINYKEALVMALIGVLRWRQEYNVLSSVTGARRNTIGGALWLGSEA